MYTCDNCICTLPHMYTYTMIVTVESVNRFPVVNSYMMPYSALTLLVGHQEEHPACNN